MYFDVSGYERPKIGDVHYGVENVAVLDLHADAQTAISNATARTLRILSVSAYGRAVVCANSDCQQTSLMAVWSPAGWAVHLAAVQ
jgi:hypothetical protein